MATSCCGLLRRGFTGVAKKEAAHMPLLGQILRALDFAFIDRSNTRSAIEAMQPAVDRLRHGMSVVIAPEGTRSLTPRLGRFKKGAFHIAMQAGAPIVPVVIPQHLRGDAREVRCCFDPARCRCACCRRST